VPDLWHRPANGMALGSAGAFLVMESRSHAEARGARPLARLGAVQAGYSDRKPGSAARLAAGQWEKIIRQSAGSLPVLSGACGAGRITAEEHEFLASRAKIGPVRGTAAAMGHTMEASFLANLGLAITCLEQGRVFPALSADEPIEARAGGSADGLIVTGWGHYRGEGSALIERIA
jgi:3-oxoacyl-[acyl-carrier-protein] synthase II